MLTTALLALVGTASAGSLLWDGRMNDYKTTAFLDDWSWSNQAGPYQWYIHGSGATSNYLALSSDYKNPADTSSTQGIQVTIDKTSSWNGQTMLRTELIPQTSAAINEGKVFYHFSLQHTGTNPPTPTEEHQVCFFESHFTEMKFGSSGGSSNLLQWYADSTSHWNVSFEAGVWHNIAYGIDFDAQTVEFYHSTGAKDLTLTAGPVSASTSSNGADWHLGVLRLPSGTGDAASESWHFSGVYIEKGELTKSVSGSAAATGSSSASAATSTAQAASRQLTTLKTKVRIASKAAQASSGLVSDAQTQPTSYSVSSSSAALSTSCSEETNSTTSVAENPAPTFSATGSISLTYTAPTTLRTWYAETAAASKLFATPTTNLTEKATPSGVESIVPTAHRDGPAPGWSWVPESSIAQPTTTDC